ncbi:unnamed protein product [Phytophthora fragariaefolia]|uniref:Unnamed protein product n=1 Tax=Phytophthora fragariaefolia TaxID=1490495 RepID=A0A9W6YAU3_9STRA|nr:unnamed protein product [Phytophthora fragariaefolia]
MQTLAKISAKIEGINRTIRTSVRAEDAEFGFDQEGSFGNIYARAEERIRQEWRDCVDTQVEQKEPITEESDLGVSAPGADAIGPNIKGRSAVRRRGKRGASAPGANAASSVDSCTRPAPEMLACSRAVGVHDEAVHNQARLDCVRPRDDPTDEQSMCARVQPGCTTKRYTIKPGLNVCARGLTPPAMEKHLSTAGPRQKNTCGTGFRTRSERRKRAKLLKPRSETETLQAVSAGQTQRLETTVETLSVLTRTDTGLQYRMMALKCPPTLASKLTSLPAMNWKRFARDLHDGRIEQICILSDVKRMKCEAEELKQLDTEGADALSAKSKEERFDEQRWDSLKSSPLYEVLREYKDVLPDDIPAELPQDKGVQHEIDLVTGTNAPTFCVNKAQDGWHIVHAYNKLNDATVPAQTPIPRKDVIIDSMALSTIFSALDLRDGFCQILMRESDIPLTAVSTPGAMLWEWLIMPEGLKNVPATFNRSTGASRTCCARCATSHRAMSMMYSFTAGL